MNVHQFELGPWDNFIYVIADDGGDCAVVDPAWHAPTILKYAEEKGLRITDVLCTHSHFDHVNAVDDIVDATDARVHMLQAEIDFGSSEDAPSKPGLNYLMPNLNGHAPGDVLSVGGVDITMVHTPGHTPGSVSFLVRERLIAGDTLFVDGCGRCDLVGGDPAVMYETLKRLFEELPGDTTLMPGHNYGKTPTSPLQQQQQTNPFLKHTTLEAFVAHRMEGRTAGTRLPEPEPWSPEQ